MTELSYMRWVYFSHVISIQMIYNSDGEITVVEIEYYIVRSIVADAILDMSTWKSAIVF